MRGLAKPLVIITVPHTAPLLRPPSSAYFPVYAFKISLPYGYALRSYYCDLLRLGNLCHLCLLAQIHCFPILWCCYLWIPSDELGRCSCMMWVILWTVSSDIDSILMQLLLYCLSLNPRLQSNYSSKPGVQFCYTFYKCVHGWRIPRILILSWQSVPLIIHLKKVECSVPLGHPNNT